MARQSSDGRCSRRSGCRCRHFGAESPWVGAKSGGVGLSSGIGGGVLLAGALLVVISPDHKTTTGLRTIAPWVGANNGGVGISGVW